MLEILPGGLRATAGMRGGDAVRERASFSVCRGFLLGKPKGEIIGSVEI